MHAGSARAREPHWHSAKVLFSLYCRHLSQIVAGYTKSMHPNGSTSAIANQEMLGPVEKARRHVRLWIYVLADFFPQTRQRLSLPLALPSEREPSCSCSATLDAMTTRVLLDECLSRGVSLDSVLLASLFLAAAEAVRVDGANVASRRLGEATARPFAIRAQRGLVLGLVCIVMTLLSGSVESKAMRYFCSAYAVIAGVWAVNAATVKLPGYMVLMATSAVIKGAAGVTFTPVRLAVDCWRDVWETAERHGRHARDMALSMSSFARFKMRRGRWQRRRRAAVAGAVVVETGKPPPPIQLFGCIRLEGSEDGARLAPSPEEALGVRRAEPTTTAGGSSGATADAVPENVPDAAALLLIVLDSMYTLVFRERATGDRSGHDTISSRVTGEGGGYVEGDDRGGDQYRAGVAEAVAAATDARAAVELDLTLVEGKRALCGDGSRWLLERARAILVEGCRLGVVGGGASGVNVSARDR